jgi:hypothetical protein
LYFHFHFLPPYFCGTVFFRICSHLSNNGEETGCPFADGTCWTPLVKRQHVFLEYYKLLFLSGTLTMFILFSFSFASPQLV